MTRTPGCLNHPALVVLVCLLPAIGALGCDRKSERAPEAKADCAEQAAAFKVWLAALVQDERWSGGAGGQVAFGGDPQPGQPTLAKAAWNQGQPPVKGPRLVVPAGAEPRVVLDGFTMQPEELAAGLSRNAAEFKKVFPDKPVPPPMLMLDSGVPWSRVLAVTAAAASAEHDRIQFVFRPAAGSHATEPPPSSVAAQIAKLYAPDAAGKMKPTPRGQKSAFDQLYAKIGAGCKPVPELRHAWKQARSAGAAAGSFRAYCAKHLPAALGACGCAIEIPALQQLLWAARPEPLIAKTVSLVEPDPGATACTPITAPPAADWKSVAPQLLEAPADKPVCLSARDAS